MTVDRSKRLRSRRSKRGTGNSERRSAALLLPNSIAILGAGYIGTSLGLALRRSGYQGRIAAWDRRSANARKAVERGGADLAASTLRRAVEGAELAVVAVPAGAVVAVLRTLARLPNPPTTIDVCGVKSPAVRAAARLPRLAFLGGHPMGGGAGRGPGDAHARLFEGFAFILCPGPTTTRPLRRWGQCLSRAIGARPVFLSAARQDRLVATLSHLPHAIALALWETALARAGAPAIRSLAGGSLRAATRVLGSDPAMTAGMVSENCREVAAALSAFKNRLSAVGRQFRRPAELRDRIANARRALGILSFPSTSHRIT